RFRFTQVDNFWNYRASVSLCGSRTVSAEVPFYGDDSGKFWRTHIYSSGACPRRRADGGKLLAIALRSGTPQRCAVVMMSGAASFSSARTSKDFVVYIPVLVGGDGAPPSNNFKPLRSQTAIKARSDAKDFFRPVTNT